MLYNVNCYYNKSYIFLISAFMFGYVIVSTLTIIIIRHMTIDEALRHFKSGYEMCKKLDIAYTNLVRWKKQGFIPVKQQLRINEITGVNMPIDLDKDSIKFRLGIYD